MVQSEACVASLGLLLGHLRLPGFEEVWAWRVAPLAGCFTGLHWRKFTPTRPQGVVNPAPASPDGGWTFPIQTPGLPVYTHRTQGQLKNLKKWGLSPITSSVHILKITLITHALGNCTERFKVKSTLSSLLLDVILGAGRGAKVVWPVASWEGGRATPRLMDTAENEKNLGLRVWRLLRGLNLESR